MLFLWQNAVSINKTKITADYLSGKYGLGRGGWQGGWSEGKWFNQTSVVAGTKLGVQAANVTSCSWSRECGERSKRQEISSVGRLCHSEPLTPSLSPSPNPFQKSGPIFLASDPGGWNFSQYHKSRGCKIHIVTLRTTSVLIIFFSLF